MEGIGGCSGGYRRGVVEGIRGCSGGYRRGYSGGHRRVDVRELPCTVYCTGGYRRVYIVEGM